MTGEWKVYRRLHTGYKSHPHHHWHHSLKPLPWSRVPGALVPSAYTSPWCSAYVQIIVPGGFKTPSPYPVNVVNACYLTWVMYLFIYFWFVFREYCQHPSYFWSTPLPWLVHIFLLVQFCCWLSLWEFLSNFCNEVSTSYATVSVLLCCIDCPYGVCYLLPLTSWLWPRYLLLTDWLYMPASSKRWNFLIEHVSAVYLESNHLVL